MKQMNEPTNPPEIPDWLREEITRPGVPGPLRTDVPTTLPITVPAEMEPA